jgi:adenylate cyclase
MPPGHDVIDLATDPLAARADRRRTIRRIGVPVLGVILMIAVILVIAVYASRANRQGAMALSDDVLTALDARVAEEVVSYFGVPTRALAIGEKLAGDTAAGEPRRALVENFSIGALKEIPQIADFIFGDADGNFMMVRRNDSGGMDTKTIQNAPGARKVLWIRRNAAGEQTGTEEDPTDTFDPRTRPWYAGALAADGKIFWTDPYIFFTAKELGITASTRYQTAEGRTFVVGVDITLNDLSNFLADLRVGETGRAMIINNAGQILAYPHVGRTIRQNGSDAVTPSVDQIGDAPAVSAHDHFRVSGPGQATVTVDNKRYLATLTPLKAIGHDWSVMIVLPEDDFVGFVARNNLTGLTMSLAIVAIAVLLAVLLVRQGLRGDRSARLARDTARAMAHQGAALDRLAEEDELFDQSRGHLPDTMTEIVSDLTAARRASLWYFRQNGALLRCADRFYREASGHTAGLEIQRSELPEFFDHLVEGAEIDAVDAARDPRTAELHRLMLAPAGSRSLLVVPIRRHERVVGSLWLEDWNDAIGSRRFLRVLASLAALHAADDAPDDAPQLAAEAGIAASEPEAVCSLSTDLMSRGLDAQVLGDALYADVSVMVVRLDDPSAPADCTKRPELIDAVICAVQELATEQQIPYLKLVGCDIVGAAGFSTGDPTAAARIANIAVAARDRISDLFKAHGLVPNFRVGIDSGAAIGRFVGAEPALFNLWGEAVQTAQTMALAALPGAIQTSEKFYQRLRYNFLFRPRGSFHLPLVGRTQTFVLAGRL